ncbi:MAG: hypothetical protein J7J01_00970 [Methanophagales archaeon]|nr:hypothetical protein [Methanophagales archaeon]
MRFDIVTAAVLAVLLVVVPLIPGVILWLLLHPETFWQKLALFLVSLILFLLVLQLEAKIAHRLK